MRRGREAASVPYKYHNKKTSTKKKKKGDVPVAALSTVCSCGSSASKRLTISEWKKPAGRFASGVTLPVAAKVSRRVWARCLERVAGSERYRVVGGWRAGTTRCWCQGIYWSAVTTSLSG